MIARTAVVALSLFTAALLQTSFFSHVSLAGFRPDLLLLVTALMALREGPLVGLRVGLAAGLISDLLLNQSAVGLGAVVFVGVGYSAGVIRPYLAHESLTAPLLLSAMASMLGTAGYGLLTAVLGDTAIEGRVVVETALVVGLYNTMLAPPVDAGVRWLGRAFPVETATSLR